MARNPEEAQRVVIPLGSEEALAFLGQADRNLKRLRSLFRTYLGDEVRLVSRGEQVEVLGPPEAVEKAERALRDLLALLRQGAELDEATLEQAIDRGTIICGSPETVVAQIKRVHAALGHGVFNFTVKVGNVPDAVIRHGMELFRDRVLPHVRDL